MIRMPVPIDETDETVTFARSDVARLAEAIEDVEARAAYAATRGEEKLPNHVVRRLCGGESPLSVFREHRGLSSAALAARAGVLPGRLDEAEAGTLDVSASELAALARVLEVDADDLLP